MGKSAPLDVDCVGLTFGGWADAEGDWRMLRVGVVLFGLKLQLELRG